MVKSDDKNSSKNRYLFAGAGTGGHLYPAIALAEEIQRTEKTAEILFVGTSRGIENKVLPQTQWPLRRIAVRGFKRKLSFENIVFPIRLIMSMLQAVNILKEFKPHVVVGTGGYVSGPVVFAAWLLGIPRLIQEQNALPGVTTRMLSRISNEVFVSFTESLRYFKNMERLKVSGNPVRRRPENIKRTKACETLGLDARLKTVLVFGGSQGAHSINAALYSALDTLMQKKDVQIVWGTGIHDFEDAGKIAKKYNNRVLVKAYIENMPVVYQATDVAVCRAGAITISELELFGLPALLIPYPFAAARHQEENARTLQEHDAARMILDEELTGPRLIQELSAILDNETKRLSMAENMANLARPDATKEIVQSIRALAARYS